MRKDLFWQLADKFEAGFSKTFPKILKFLVDEEDIRILSATPGNTKEVAKKLNRGENEIAEKLKELHMRGFTILEGITSDGPKYSLMDVGKFMDSILFDTRYDKYGDDFFHLWKTFYNQEFLPAQKENASFNFRILYGCGLCASNCPNGAIELIEVSPRDHIPAGEGFGVGWSIPNSWSTPDKDK